MPDRRIIDAQARQDAQKREANQSTAPRVDAAVSDSIDWPLFDEMHRTALSADRDDCIACLAAALKAGVPPEDISDLYIPALARRMGEQGCTFERYRTMHEAANDPVLVDQNPLFTRTSANPSGFEYPATRSFANLPGREPGDPAPAPYLGQHSEEVLADKLGLSGGAIGKLVDAGTVALSDKDKTYNR